MQKTDELRNFIRSFGSKTRKFLAKAPDKYHAQQSTKEKEAHSKEQVKGPIKAPYKTLLRSLKAPYKTLLRSLMSLLVSNMIRNIQNNC